MSIHSQSQNSFSPIINVVECSRSPEGPSISRKGEVMTIEAALSKEQLTRLLLLRHIQRSTFYIYALACAALTAYGLVFGPLIVLLVGWVPFLIYLASGFLGARSGVRNENHPALLKTRYVFEKSGVLMSNSQGQSVLDWKHFSEWKVIAKCYILILAGGAILAIPQSDVPKAQLTKFENLLDRHIKK